MAARKTSKAKTDNNKEFFEALKLMEEERGIPREFIADKINIVPLVLQIHQLAQKLIAAFLHSRAEGYHHVFIIDRVSQ